MDGATHNGIPVDDIVEPVLLIANTLFTRKQKEKSNLPIVIERQTLLLFKTFCKLYTDIFHFLLNNSSTPLLQQFCEFLLYVRHFHINFV